MLMRDPKRDASGRDAAKPLWGTLVAVGLIGVLLCGTTLLLVSFAGWAGDHPLAAVLFAVFAVPALYAVFRGRPRTRELRRAARAGMAQADREQAETSPSRDPEDPVGDLPDIHRAPRNDEISPDAFEAAVAALCERDGCREVEVVGDAGDLGADVTATAPDGRRVVLQCKRYDPSHKVGSQDLQRFGGTCWTVHGAQVAAVVTTSGFTAPAQEYAQECGIRCVDGAALDAWSEGSGPAPWGPTANVRV